MKRLVIFVSIFVLLFTGNAIAVFNSGSTGADGAFNPTSNTQLQLPPSGIFNFTTVNIPAGVTVTFAKNAANTPVYILATGDVTVSGAIDISGTSASGTVPGAGGPGGYAGGYGAAAGSWSGDGLGPGGGHGAINCWGGGGGYGTGGGQYGGCGAGGATYGNVRIMPLIGGAGGAGSSAIGGGGGGGAILIASSGSIVINGTILSGGGTCNSVGGGVSGGGSGGAIKLIANAINGNGSISATGGSCYWSEVWGGKGRIRLEAYTNNRTAGTDPTYSYGQPGSVFPANPPALSITSIAGVNVPANPTGSYNQPDMMFPSTTTNPVAVTVSANYIPVGTTVTVRVMPQYGGATDVTTTLSGTLASSTGSANVNLSTQYSNVVTAQATFTLQLAMYYDGEKIERVKVAAIMGKEPETVYITESGKEIKAKELIMAGLVK